MGEVDRRHRADLRRPRRRPPELSRPMSFLDRGIQIKTPEQIDRHAPGRPGRGGDPRAAARRACGPGSPPVSSTRSPRTTSARGRDAVVPGLPRRSPARSAPRSTTRSCTASRATRMLAEGDVVSIDCGAIVDGWHGDAAITVAVGRGRRRGHRADAGHRGGPVARHRRRPPRRPGHRHLPRRGDPRAAARATTASSRTTSGTASAPRCTSRPTCPTSAAPAAGPKLVRGPGPGRGADGHARRQGHRRCSRTTGRSSPPTAAWAAHFEHTFTLTPTGAWVLTALDGGEAALTALGVPFGGSLIASILRHPRLGRHDAASPRRRPRARHRPR